LYDAVEGEDLLDSDDDNDWDDPMPSEPSKTEPSDANNNPTIPAEADEPPSEMTEQQLMLLSNAALREELRKQIQSTNGNKSVVVQRLLTRVTKHVPGNRAASRTRNNTEEGEDAAAEHEVESPNSSLA
jgi:hypothetical protein